MRLLIESRHVSRGLRDVVLGLGLFLVLAIGFAGNPMNGTISSWAVASDVATLAALGSMSPTGSTAETVLAALQRPAFAETHRLAAFAVLAMSFSMMFAFNLAFWRHLRRVYASPR